MEEIRLQKYLSQAWICSRRKWEEYIMSWLVLVNWNTAELWQKVDPTKDKIEIKDKIIKDREKFVYIKMNKPRWIVTTCAQNEEKAIVDIIDINERVFPIWRLDKDTTGLILLTNDGRIANYLMHPKYEHEKEYLVKVYWPISDKSLTKMSKWLFILWSMTKKCRVERVNAWTFRIFLKEWRNRQIRRMVEAVWWEVKWLKRIRIENIELWNMKEWEYKHLSKSELKWLKSKLGIS